MNPLDLELGAGVLLVAPPAMADPNFRRAVVLLCEHGQEGSFGLILNRPLTLHLSDVMEGPEIYEDPLSLGGPVQPNTLHFLHRYGGRVPDAIPVLDEVFWGGDFDQVRSLALTEHATGQTLRFFLGYAGWSEDQLNEEVEEESWILARADDSLIFREDPDKLWGTVMRRLGGDYALLANFPEDPRMN